MVRPFRPGLLHDACPMEEVLGSLSKQLEELRVLKSNAAT